MTIVKAKPPRRTVRRTAPAMPQGIIVKARSPALIKLRKRQDKEAQGSQDSPRFKR
jgi:hypothetical protein